MHIFSVMSLSVDVRSKILKKF